jgi:hypothetical protein
MRTYFSKVVFGLAVTLVTLTMAGIAEAQPRVARGRVYTKGDVDRIIKRVEDSTDKFKKEFDKALDRSRLNNTNREDQLNQYAKDLEHAIFANSSTARTSGLITKNKSAPACPWLLKLTSRCATGAWARKSKVAGMDCATTSTRWPAFTIFRRWARLRIELIRRYNFPSQVTL